MKYLFIIERCSWLSFFLSWPRRTGTMGLLVIGKFEENAGTTAGDSAGPFNGGTTMMAPSQYSPLDRWAIMVMR